MPGTIHHYYLSCRTGGEVVIARNARLSIPRHLHASYSIGIQEAGARRMLVQGLEEIVVAGNVLFVNPGEAHTCATISAEGEAYSILSLPASDLDFASAAVFGVDGRMLHLPSPALRQEELYHSLLAFFTVVRKPHSRMEEDEALQNALAALLKAISGYAPSQSGNHENMRQAVNLAQQYIHAHYGREIPLAELAQAAFCSPFHLVRSFSKENGVPPHVYQTLLRLKQARLLLREGLPLAKAALQSGFCDQAHFTHVFKKFNGVPPGAFLNEENPR